MSVERPDISPEQRELLQLVLESFYEAQAAEVSAEGLAEVSAFVLDCRPEAGS